MKINKLLSTSIEFDNAKLAHTERDTQDVCGQDPLIPFLVDGPEGKKDIFKNLKEFIKALFCTE